MSSPQNERPAGPGAAGGDWWSRRPRRSGTDRKIAGVAGGIGRTFGVDPVLIRVVFVVLTIFAGFGLTLYVLGWLLLPADGDEVSPGEALLGRGRSATPPILAVVLTIVAAISIFSSFSWGKPFWLLAVVGGVAIVIARRRGRQCTPRDQNAVDEWTARVSQAGRSWGEQAEHWVARQPWSGSGSSSTRQQSNTRQGQSQSPFDQPAFWDGSDGADPARVNLRKQSSPDGAGQGADRPGSPAEPPVRQPPAWDPLGVAPFAWDLPEPAPAAPPPPAPRQRSVIGRITLGMVLLFGALATIGIFQGWWDLTWARVSAIALTIVAVGLLIASLRGRGGSLIGPGIFLSLLTLALTITGINGTAGYGQQNWTPTSVAAAEQPFELNGGQGTLDLRQLTVPAGQTVDTEVTVRAGQATVIVPKATALNVTCSANAGEVDCLGETASGLQREVTTAEPGSPDRGTINLTVHVGAGQGQVRHG
jgi:phage shock protein PspC (stress-responsive transcriptional regulator)